MKWKKGSLKTRSIKDKNNCIICGNSTSTFVGYWVLKAAGSYSNYNKETNQEEITISEYKCHIGCYIEKYKKSLLCGLIPLGISNEIIEDPKKIIELMKMHEVPIETLKEKIDFLNLVLKEYSKK